MYTQWNTMKLYGMTKPWDSLQIEGQTHEIRYKLDGTEIYLIKDIMLSVVSQKKKDKYRMILLICGKYIYILYILIYIE